MLLASSDPNSRKISLLCASYPTIKLSCKTSSAEADKVFRIETKVSSLGTLSPRSMSARYLVLIPMRSEHSFRDQPRFAQYSLSFLPRPLEFICFTTHSGIFSTFSIQIIQMLKNDLFVEITPNRCCLLQNYVLR